MVNYSKVKGKKSLDSKYHSLPVAKGNIFFISLIFLSLILTVLTIPITAFGKDKVAVLPFKIESNDPAANLKTELQKMFSQHMNEMGYEVIDTELINSRLGKAFSYLDLEKDIIPLGKYYNADWIIMGEFTQAEENIHLNIKVIEPDSAKTPFSVMMIENERKNLPEAIRKIAESLSIQINKNILISEIIVEGNKRVSDDAIRTIIESQKGEKFDQDKLNRDLKTIYKMGFFNDINYQTSDVPGGKVISFNVVEKPAIIRISFKGNKKKKKDKLLEELGIKLYSVLDHNEIKQSINRLNEYYKTAGYYNIEIKKKIKELSDNEVTLTYIINEGEKVHISKIQFEGNEVFDDDDLKDIMLTKKKGWLTWFTDAGVLDWKKLEFDLQQGIPVFYDNRGYIKARVGEPEVTYDEEEKGLIVTIPIIEGEQYTINDIIFEGDLIRPVDELRNLLEVKKGEPYSRQIIYNEIDKIKGLYASLGYAYVEVLPNSHEKENSNIVDLSIKIEKNKKVRFERINFSGNRLTRDKVIRRELKIAEGEYFNGRKLNQSGENLDRLDRLFESHEINTRRGSSDDLMIVDINVEEKLPGSITFSAGYGGYAKFAAMIQYENRNLNGRGQNFELDAMFGSNTTKFNATFTEPWLFDKPVRGSITAYNWDTDYDDYTKEQLGGNVWTSFLLGLDEFTRGTVRYTHEKAKVTDIYFNAPDVVKDMEGSYITKSITLGISRNSKNRWWNTTKGSSNTFTLESAGGFLGGDTGFNKYTFNSSYYFPVFWKTVLVASASVGYVEKKSDGKLPLYEKFRLGGIDSVRGYEWGTISPLDPATGGETGGDKMWLYKIEYRFPLTKSEGITGLIFYDAGNAFEKDASWKSGAGHSVGFGVRWFSPMGPLRLEYGIKLNERPNDTDSGKFEFKIGGSF